MLSGKTLDFVSLEELRGKYCDVLSKAEEASVSLALDGLKQAARRSKVADLAAVAYEDDGIRIHATGADENGARKNITILLKAKQ